MGFVMDSAQLCNLSVPVLFFCPMPESQNGMMMSQNASGDIIMP